jgi:hypothetical protein
LPFADGKLNCRSRSYSTPHPLPREHKSPSFNSLRQFCIRLQCPVCFWSRAGIFLFLARCKNLPGQRNDPMLSSGLSFLRRLPSSRRARSYSTVLPSGVDVRSAEFAANARAGAALVADLRARLASARAGGGPRAVAKHVARGKLPVRERVAGLLDAGSPFLELSPLAGGASAGGRAGDDDDVPAAGIVTGIGRVHGQEVMVVANDATVKGGTYYPITVKKHLRAQEVAAANRLPCVYLVDSGGAFLPRQVREEAAGGLRATF